MTPNPKKPSGVVKRMYSLPRGLYNYVVKQAKEIGRQEGKRPNVSGFIAKLVFAHKFSNNNPGSNTEPNH